jgi:hypothetical protein
VVSCQIRGKCERFCTQISGDQMNTSSLRRIVCTIERRDACVPTLGFCLKNRLTIKGFGCAVVLLCSPRLIAACRSTSEWKTPRRKRRRVSVAKKLSTALTRDRRWA